MKALKNIVLATIIPLSLYNCARQTTPEGGPKDITKPELISSTPQNNQKNFKGKKIELLFSEDVKLKEPKEEILITPSPGKEIKFEAAGNKVTIEPKLGWKDSTTYNILFRESVQDITESNPTEDLHLAFSTGPTIDSLSITGKIKDARKETIPEKITIAIYTQDTFNIFNHAPSYFTKSDKNGNFKLENLKQGDYFIYAFDDKNKNLKVESTNEKYGFKSSQIRLTKNYDSLEIALTNLDSRPIKLNSNRSNSQTTLLRFNKNLVNYQTTFDKTNLLTTHGDNQTEIVFYYYANQPNDSIKIRLQATDSLKQQFDSIMYIKPGTSKAIKTTFSISTEPTTFNYETGILELKGKTNIPLSAITEDSLYIRLDTLKKINLKHRKFTLDTLTKKFVFTAQIDTAELTTQQPNEEKNQQSEKIRRKANTQLILGKGLLISIYNDSSKTQTINLPSKELNDSGSLSVNISTNTKNYHIELLNANNEIIQSFFNKQQHTFTKLKAQEYKLRAYIDVNNNGKWDTSNIRTRTEPEPIHYYKTIDNKYNFPVRENWDVGPLTFKF